MIIITDCLTKHPDEGCLNVANSLIKRIKRKYPDTTVISFSDRTSDLSDVHMNLNKFFLNKELFKFIKEKQEPVFFIPFSSNTKGNVIRTLTLSLFSSYKVKVLFAMKQNMNILLRTILKIANPKIYTLSKESYSYFNDLGYKDAIHLTTGVDIQKFVPVSKERKQELRNKYGIADKSNIALHVGHLKEGRNIQQFLKLPKDIKGYIIISEAFEQDQKLRNQLEDHGVTIIDKYISNIEEIYQLSDFYFFPVQEESNCIDTPLSVLEAASCNLPVLTTDYGELKAFINKEGFFFIDEFNEDILKTKVDEILALEEVKTRLVIEKYDWSLSVEQIME